MNYLDVTINGFRYTQRNEFSKIVSTNIIEGDSGFYDSFDELPEDVKTYINDLNKIKENPDEYFEYTTVDNEIQITNIIPNGLKNIIIPETIHGFAVGDLFIRLEDRDIERIIMPNTIKSLHQSNFAGCKSLKEVYLPNKVDVLPHSIFFRCERLKNINLENIKLIHENALRECLLLKNIKLDNLEVIGGSCFLGCESLEKIIAPKLNHISESAFAECHSLKEIVFSPELQRIGPEAFSRCFNLSKINLPENLKEICREAFAECKTLKTIIIPENVRVIQKGAFIDSGLTGEITIPKTVQTIKEFAFSHCELSKINVSKYTQIDDWAFSIEQKMKINIYDEPKKKEKKSFIKNIFDKDK